MKIPGFPKTPFINPEDKTMHSAWRVFFNQLINQLQAHFSDSGYFLPRQDDATINTLNTDTSIGSILYSSNSKSAKINTQGTFNIITTYEELTSAQVGTIPSGERNGRFIYETDTGDLKFGVNNLFKTVQLV